MQTFNLKQTISAIALCILLSLPVFQTSSENQSKTLKGDLSFKLIGFYSYYGSPDSLINKFELMMDSLSASSDLSIEDSVFISAFNLLKSNNLFELPSFELRIDSAHSAQVYLEEVEYEKIKKYDHQQLIHENKKVELVLEVEIIADGVVRCKKIISSKKVDGKTYWRK
jgi:hypothetical protein